MSAPVLTMGALSVAAGEIAVLPGEDSAQKTALLETIMGFRPGAVMMFGMVVSALAVEQRVRLGVGYNFTGFTDQDLTQEEYTNQGFFIALRWKFDEALVPRRKDGTHP